MVLIKLCHALAERRRVEPVQINGFCQMSGSKFVGLAHVEDNGGRVRFGSRNKLLRSKHLHTVLRRAARAQPERGHEGKE